MTSSAPAMKRRLGLKRPDGPNRSMFPRGESGLSMLDLILAISIFSVAASFLIPSVDRYVTQNLKEQTRDEMTWLADSVIRFYRDVGSFPAKLDDLTVKPAGATSWQGPYLEATFPDQANLSDDYRFDQWLEAYLLPAAPDFYTFRIRSKGENRVDESGEGDDLQVDIYVGEVLREITDLEIAELNVAIANYNQQNLPGTPLSSDLATLLGQLQLGGFIANDPDTKTRYTYDGWGNPYIPTASPVQEVTSQGAP